METHKTGYVSIIGKPNVGKSTLMNALVGERLSIITSKAQTTRHRIMGIVNGEHEGVPFQLVYSDTPGIIKPQYQLHQSMMNFVHGSLEDADVILFVTDIFEQYDEDDVIEKLARIQHTPVILLINKVDLAKPEQIQEKIAHWRNRFPTQTILPISALHKVGLEELFNLIFRAIPNHPPFFDKEALTDRPERFFAAEIVREKIFLNYKKEIPYSCEVVITSFKEADDIIRILAEIYVERTSQRAILLGHKGASIKKVGIESRKELEAFFGKQIHLETYVRVEADWRSKANKLREFGYIQE
ncbi:MAG: GTPase Era [Siphonobacter sp.]